MIVFLSNWYYRFLPFVIIWAHILVTESSVQNKHKKWYLPRGLYQQAGEFLHSAKKQKKEGSGFIWRHSLC